MVSMQKKVFDQLRQLVYEKSGISLGEHKEALVTARVGKRMRQLGMEDYGQYMDHLVADKTGQEIVQLLDVISTNVTHFFREAQHFDVLAELLRQWSDAGQQRFRIWCAAASSGEEPYTISMMMREVLGKNADAKLLATDISTRVLEKANEGIYEDRHVEKIPAPLLKKYFVKRGGDQKGNWEVRETLKELITYGRLNLSVFPYPLKGPLDIIFCRNVMIYFDNEMRSRVLANMYKLLKPGGYLMVGHAESLTGLVSDFKAVQPSVYIKA